MTSPEPPLCCFRFSSPSTPTPSAEDRKATRGGGGARGELLLELKGGHTHKFGHPGGTQVLQDPLCLSLNVVTAPPYTSWACVCTLTPLTLVPEHHHHHAQSRDGALP